MFLKEFFSTSYIMLHAGNIVGWYFFDIIAVRHFKRWAIFSTDASPYRSTLVFHSKPREMSLIFIVCQKRNRFIRCHCFVTRVYRGIGQWRPSPFLCFPPFAFIYFQRIISIVHPLHDRFGLAATVSKALSNDPVTLTNRKHC